LDLIICILSVFGIFVEKLSEKNTLPINPTIIRALRILRVARILKILKTAKGLRSLIETVIKALHEIRNLGLLFFLIFYIFAALGVEMFGRLCNYFLKLLLILYYNLIIFRL